MSFPVRRNKLQMVTCIVLTVLLTACVTTQAPPKPASTPSNTAEALGIELTGLHLTSGGYMLDFRYRVNDAAKAAPMVDRALIPYLVHEASGAKFAVPAPTKVGPMRQMPRQLEAGRQYFIFFANPGQYVKAGDYVTIVHGPYRFEHLKVE